MAIKVANNQSLTAITALPSAVSGGAMTLLETQTASSSSTLSFTSGIDDTYDEYVFKFINIHPQTDCVHFTFQGNAAGGSGYNETMTTTDFYSYQSEGGTTAFAYYEGGDQAQGTAFQRICTEADNDNDSCVSGFMHLYAPSNTTFVKHFMTRVNYHHCNVASRDEYIAGYFNTTSAIDEIQFKMSSGNIDAGVIKLYGIS